MDFSRRKVLAGLITTPLISQHHGLSVDWISAFMSHTSAINSPEIFRLWSGIAAVAGSMERKCWTRNNRGVLYPNLYIMLVASPGIGKTESVKAAEELIKQSKISVMPRSVTQASIIDVLKRQTKSYINGGGAPIDYNSAMIVVGELGIFVSAHDLEFLSILNEIYDNPPYYSQQRRHFNEGKEILVPAPGLNILAGTQPAFLAHLLPEEAWSMGATSRMIFIYAGSFRDDSDVFAEDGEDFSSKIDIRSDRHLVEGLSRMNERSGEFKWTPEAAKLYNAWKRNSFAPVPEHSKLQHYLPRRGVDVIKLAMVSSMSKHSGLSNSLVVEAEDFTRATDWLLAAERIMPDIFREMAGKSDNDILQELHYMVWQQMITRKAREKPASLSDSELWDFLRYRVPGEKIPRILEVAERARIIARDEKDPSRWVARPKHQIGVE